MTDEEASRRADAAAETTSKAAEFGRRLLGAALLDANTYEDVEADRSANVQAFLVVLLSAIAAGIASIDNNGVSGIFVIAPAALLGWWLWAYLTYMIGTRLLPRPETEDLVARLLADEAWWDAEARRVVDVGTGSGCIALALAKARPEATVYGVDREAAALALAQIIACLL